MSRANGKFSRREPDQAAMDALRTDKAPSLNPQPWAGEVSGNVDGAQRMNNPGIESALKALQGTRFTPKGG